MILDTDFFISLRDGEDGAIETATELERGGQPTRVPTVVIQELYVGVDAGVDTGGGTRRPTTPSSPTNRSFRSTRTSPEVLGVSREHICRVTTNRIWGQSTQSWQRPASPTANRYSRGTMTSVPWTA